MHLNLFRRYSTNAHWYSSRLTCLMIPIYVRWLRIKGRAMDAMGEWYLLLRNTPSVEPCPLRGAFQIPVTSGYYSQAAGAMAGLCFAALVLLLGTKEKEELAPRQNPDALATLFATLFSLIFSMIQYSVLAGTQGSDGRTAGGELIAGLTFTLAISMLFHALGLLLEMRPECESIADLARWVSVVIIPVCGLLFLVMGSQDSEFLHYRPSSQAPFIACPESSMVSAVGLVLVGVMAICLVMVKVTNRRSAWAHRHRPLIPAATLVLAVVSLFFFGFLGMQPSDFIAPRWALVAFLVTAWLLLTAIAAFAQLGSTKPVVTSRVIDADTVVGTGKRSSRDDDLLHKALKERGWVVILMSPKRSRVFKPGRDRR
jgi:protein-S-isoprenylcysteine O-methyltransferase Ste14